MIALCIYIIKSSALFCRGLTAPSRVAPTGFMPLELYILTMMVKIQKKFTQVLPSEDSKPENTVISRSCYQGRSL